MDANGCFYIFICIYANICNNDKEKVAMNLRKSGRSGETWERIEKEREGRKLYILSKILNVINNFFSIINLPKFSMKNKIANCTFKKN